ncbi:hypothetical protein ACQ4M4_28565 [Leptolyngbya sp. AN02str]|uniref:hypothetical protein n=1 Tax=Leptolyngbya sp. AN02str TaxID=3423363 RepID=UPI003D31B6A3
MVAFVLGFNLVLSVLLWVVAWHVWAWRRKLARAAHSLAMAERSTHQVLVNAPEWILRGQVESAGLREQYYLAQVQLQQARQALAVISAGVALWRGSLGKPKRSSTRKRGRWL